MHNYMRTYRGKIILEWYTTPEHAYRTALDLNDGSPVAGGGNIFPCPLSSCLTETETLDASRRLVDPFSSATR